MCIGFRDNTEVTLKSIIDYDIDLDKIELCTIGLTNALSDVEIENHFKGNESNQIIYVRICAAGVNLDGELFNVFYDIPCDMTIRRLRINGENRETYGQMFIELEGVIR